MNNKLSLVLILLLFFSSFANAFIVCGDVTLGGFVFVDDLTFLVNYLFKQGPAPACLTIQPIIITPEDNDVVSNPVYVAVENHGVTDFSEVRAVKIYYSTDDADWIYLDTQGPSTENLWEFSIELPSGLNYLTVIMETADEARTAPSVLIQVN